MVLFGAYGDLTVLDQTFNDVDLVGHPLSFGNFVSGNSAGFLITATTYTYTPFMVVGDDANPDPKKDETISGTPYQEVFTNFPFSSSEVTGLFLNLTLSGRRGGPDVSEDPGEQHRLCRSPERRDACGLGTASRARPLSIRFRSGP